MKLHMVDEDFAWRLAQELVKIDSSDPGAYELEIEQHIKDLVETYVAKLDSPVLDTAEIRELEVFPRALQPYDYRAGRERRGAARLHLPYGYRHPGTPSSATQALPS